MSAGQRLVLVVGIGRSGTSAFTAVLARLGFAVPQPEVQADPTNPRGFGEPQWAVDFQTPMLRRRHVSNFDGRPDAWQRMAEAADDADAVQTLRRWLSGELAAHGRVVVKDPRTVWLLPLWQRVVADLGVEVGFVTMLRRPAEVVASARRSYGPDRPDTSRLGGWLNVMLHTEEQTRSARRVFVRYDALLRDWRHELERVDRALDLGLPLGDPGAAAGAAALVDPTLRREQTEWSELDVSPRLVELADETWSALGALAADDTGAPTHGGDVPDRLDRLERLDRLRRDYVAVYTEAEEIARWSVVAARAAARRKALRGL